MQSVFNIHGEFQFGVIQVLDTEQEQMDAEQTLLDLLVGLPGCVNLSRSADRGPGMIGRQHSVESRRLISEARAHQTFSDETRAKLSASLTGHQRSLGKTASPETRAKLSAAKIGKPKSEETRRRMSEAKKGVRHSDEHRRNNALAKTGKKHSAETKAKMRASRNAHLAEHGDPRLRHVEVDVLV